MKSKIIDISVKNQFYQLRRMDLSCLFSEGFNCLMDKDQLIFRLIFVPVITWFRVQLTINLTSGNLRSQIYR